MSPPPLAGLLPRSPAQFPIPSAHSPEAANRSSPFEIGGAVDATAWEVRDAGVSRTVSRPRIQLRVADGWDSGLSQSTPSQAHSLAAFSRVFGSLRLPSSPRPQPVHSAILRLHAATTFAPPAPPLAQRWQRRPGLQHGHPIRQCARRTGCSAAWPSMPSTRGVCSSCGATHARGPTRRPRRFSRRWRCKSSGAKWWVRVCCRRRTSAFGW